MGFIQTRGDKVTSSEPRFRRKRDVSPPRESKRAEPSDRSGITRSKKLRRDGEYKPISFPEGVTDASSENWMTSDLRRKWASHKYVRIDDESANRANVNSEEAERRSKAVESWKLKIGSHIGRTLHGDKYYKLSAFPEGYALVELDRVNQPGFTDKYLVGFDHHRYRSPEEFFPHAIWLMNGKVGACDCRPGRKTNIVHHPEPTSPSD